MKCKMQNAKCKNLDIILILPPNNFTDMIIPNHNRGRQFRGYYVTYPHLGLLYIAAVLMKEDFNVKVIDSLAERLNINDILKIANIFKPKIIGITTTTPTLPIVYNLIKELNQMNNNCDIVVGGPHISYEPQILTSLNASYGIRGEAEYSFLKLCKKLIREENINENNIEGLITPNNMENTTSALIKDLDALPSPARELLDNRKYQNPVSSELTASLITTRGCPYNCTFCSRAVRGNLYNERSIKSVINEIKEVIKKFKIGYITIMDETFTYNRERVISFCNNIKEEKLKFKWATQTRANLIDEELLEKMYEVGCVNLSFGVETANDKIRKEIGKPDNINDYLNLVGICKKIGIKTNAYYMFGHEGETKEDMLNTIKLAKQLDTDYASFNITNIFPGSIIYEKFKNRLGDDIWQKYMRGEAELPIYIPNGLNKKIMQQMITKGFKAFYLRPKIIMKHLLTINSLRDLLHHLRIFLTLIKDYMFR